MNPHYYYYNSLFTTPVRGYPNDPELPRMVHTQRKARKARKASRARRVAGEPRRGPLGWLLG